MSYGYNVTAVFVYVTNTSQSSGGSPVNATSLRDPRLRSATNAINNYLVPVICLFGAAGNLINVLILLKPGSLS